MDYDFLDQMDDPMVATINAARCEEGSSPTGGYSNEYKPNRGVAPHITYPHEDIADDSSSNYSDPEMAAQEAIATIASEAQRSELRKLRRAATRRTKVIAILSAVASLAFPLGVMFGAKLAKKGR